jgi:outer membrane biosynthesis protein TonB
LADNDEFKSSSASRESGNWMSRKEIEHAEKAERDRAEKARKEKDKGDKKLQDKAEKDRKEKAKSDKKLQDTTEKGIKDKDKSDRKIQKKTEQDKREKDRGDREFQASERTRKFEEVLGAATEKSKGCCEPCNYQARTSNGEYRPCKMGHTDSGPNKKICADCSNPRYR